MASHHRQALILACITVGYVAGVVYDTLSIIPFGSVRSVLAVLVIAIFVAAFLLAKYPSSVIQPLCLMTWPLHLFTISFFASCLVIHHGENLGQVVAYTVVAYATFAMLPLLMLLDRSLFDAFVSMIAVLSAVLAIPCFLGAMGITAVLGVRFSNKPSYSDFSGIIASGGVFEHAEGHALQMAVGLFCCLYAFRKSKRMFYFLCLLMTSAGLVVSQGRGAIFGVMIAVAFIFVPELFRRAHPLFIGSLMLLLVFPFFILPQLGRVPGVANYLRLERGLSGRDVAWGFAISLIQEKPWTGHGFLSSGELTESHKKVLRRSGYSGAGTTFHNTFITKAVELGVIAAAVYLLLYLVPLLRICETTEYEQEQQLVRSIVLVTLTASIFRDYNIGGVRSTAMIGAIFLGIANLWPMVELWWQPTPMSTAATHPPSELP